MNKFKVSKKEVKENYRILGTGYCTMQNLLRHKNAFAYSAGVNGWACDYYLVNVNGEEVIISTGYNALNSKRINLDYTTIKEYEEKARMIDCDYDYNMDYQDRVKAIDTLLIELLEKGIK